jgi:Ca2+-binding EF-hand superfamily protein
MRGFNGRTSPEQSFDNSHEMATSSYMSSTLQASTNYKEAFALFDKRGNGRVAVSSLGDLLRACGQNPTLSDIKTIEQDGNLRPDCKYKTRLLLIYVRFNTVYERM